MNKEYSMSLRAMGCYVNVWLETEVNGEEILSKVPGWIENVESHLSRFRPNSEISELNKRSGRWKVVSDIMLANLQSAKIAAHWTNGLSTPLIANAVVAAGYDRSFDEMDRQVSQARGVNPQLANFRNIRIENAENRVLLPGEIDLGGTAKGWTAREIAKRLRQYGDCLVDMGGDMVAYGERDWLIDIGDPCSDNDIITTIKLKNEAVATSGIDYRHWMLDGQFHHHIIDPRTGKPADTAVLSVTIVHPDVVIAEASARAVLILGSKKGLAWLGEHGDTSGLIICKDSQILSTRYFTDWISEDNNG